MGNEKYENRRNFLKSIGTGLGALILGSGCMGKINIVPKRKTFMERSTVFRKDYLDNKERLVKQNNSSIEAIADYMNFLDKYIAAVNSKVKQNPKRYEEEYKEAIARKERMQEYLDQEEIREEVIKMQENLIKNPRIKQGYFTQNFLEDMDEKFIQAIVESQ